MLADNYDDAGLSVLRCWHLHHFVGYYLAAAGDTCLPRKCAHVFELSN